MSGPERGARADVCRSMLRIVPRPCAQSWGPAATALAAVALGLPWSAARAQAPTPSPLAFDQPGMQAAASLQVSVPGVAEGGLLPTNYTASGRNLSPPVSWTPGPPATTSYALVMQDADAASGGVHWVAYSMPKTLTALPRGMHNLAEPAHPLGVAQGQNDHGSLGYSGPRPSPGDPPHHYHLQVFALDRAPRVRPGATLALLDRAMAGHVVARGELVATYPAPAPPPGSGKAGSAPPPAGPTP